MTIHAYCVGSVIAGCLAAEGGFCPQNSEEVPRLLNARFGVASHDE
jgi:hypothetical protein